MTEQFYLLASTLRIKNLNFKRQIYVYVHCTEKYNFKVLKPTKVSNNKQLQKEVVVNKHH